jgi:hypothetical protein
MKHLLSIICSLVFCFSILFSSCRTWKDEEEDCLTKYSEWPRYSTTTKEISWIRCYYENGGLKEQSFSFDESGCFHHTDYYSKARTYYPNGRIEKKYWSIRKKERTKEYFTTGGLRSKERSKQIRSINDNIYKIENDTDTIYGARVDLVKLRLYDSVSSKRVRTVKKDTVFIYGAKF